MGLKRSNPLRKRNPTQGNYSDKEIKRLRFEATKKLTKGERDFPKQSKSKLLATYKITLPSGKHVIAKKYKK